MLEINTDLAIQLCEKPTRHAQLELLRLGGSSLDSNLAKLLELAGGLVRHDPGRARTIAQITVDLSETIAPHLIPQANYLQAQTYAVNGQFQEALTFIESAHNGYLALRQQLPALRTNLGRMNVLGELGRHQEALSVGEQTIEALQNNDEPNAQVLTTLVQQNRGICYRRVGQYEQALQAYQAAESGMHTLQMLGPLGEVRNNRGLILMHLGRVGEAIIAFEAAIQVAEETNNKVLHVSASINQGEAYLQLGQYTLSLDALNRAKALSEQIEAQTNHHFIALHRADVYQALNLYREATDDYQRANEAFKQSGMGHYQARALWGMGAALSAQSKPAEAGAVLEEAITHFEQADNVPMVCGVLLEQSALHALQGQVELARQTAERALGLVRGQGWPVQEVYAHIRLADLAMPDLPAVAKHLASAETLAQNLVFPQLHYRLIQRVGHLRWQEGREDEAEILLNQAVKGIEQMRGTVAHEAMRVSFLRDKITAYEDLLQFYLSRQQWQEAFRVAERAKSRTLAELLAGMTDSFYESEEITTLQAELNAIYNQFLTTSVEDNRHDLQSRAIEIEQTIRRLHLQSPKQGDPLIEALPADIQWPDNDVTTIAFHVISDEIMAFVVIEGELTVHRQLCSVQTVQGLLQRLNIQWDRFRAAEQFIQRHITVLERSVKRVLGALYEALLAPFMPKLLADNEKLTIIPHGIVHQVPIHALWDGEQYLLDSFEIVYAPSAMVSRLCAERETDPAGMATIMGVVDELIPDVAVEVQAIANQTAHANPLLNEEATIKALKQKASESSILHIACHGVFRADNPMFSALKLHDGWLTATEAMQLDLPGSLVTLSACESGVSEVMAGDELLGLTRAFLSAGASTLVVSLWLVQDSTTINLMADWYRGLNQGASRASALRQAQINLRKQYPHPYYWAPFVVIGRR